MDSSPPRDLYSISELALELGITPRAIRFYEQKGLLSPRRAGAHRVLDRRDRVRLLLILRGKRLGFSLDDIAEYLRLYAADRTQVAQMRMLLAATRQRQAELQRQRHDLDVTLAELGDIERQVLRALASQGATEAGATEATDSDERSRT